jgi:hypothetical protein
MWIFIVGYNLVDTQKFRLQVYSKWLLFVAGVDSIPTNFREKKLLIGKEPNNL